MENASFFWWVNLTNMTFDSSDRTFSTFADRDAIVGVSSIVSILSIAFNVTVIITILSKENLRGSMFLWSVLALCFSDLIIGALVVPMGVSYTHKGRWIHGEELCKAWMVLDMTHFGLSANILAALNVDRWFRRNLIINPRLQRWTDKLLPPALFISPWIYTGVCLTVLLVGERDFQIPDIFTTSICIFLLEEQYFLPSIIITIVAPMVCLICITLLTILLHKFNNSPWSLLNENGEDETEVRLNKTSTTATWIASIVTIVTWFPNVVDVILLVICRPPNSNCFPDLKVYLAFYMLASFSSCITPIVWFVHSGIRDRFVENMLHLCGKCCSVQDSIQGVLALQRRRYPWDPRETELLEDPDL